MDRIITKTKYSRKENKKFLIFYMLHKQLTIYFMFGFIVLLTVLTIVNVLNGQSPLFSVIMLALTFGLTAFMFISKLNDVVKNETPEKVKSTDTIEVTKYKFTRSNDVISGKAVFGWNNIDTICETDEYIYIYNTDNTGIYLKKADFVEGTIEDFRSLALKNLPKNKKGKLNYKRYGKVKREYRLEMKEKKAKDKSKGGKK
ncbi:MAG: YcxB family protein [Bacilli bacterium]|nr:YcxB family protein [Bacilli bacterium]